MHHDTLRVPPPPSANTALCRRRRCPPSFRNVPERSESSNLLLDGDFCAKIADFGLARSTAAATGGGGGGGAHTMTAGCGTVHWMAPEVMWHDAA